MKNLNILIVEDNQVISLTLQTRLKRLGFHTVNTSSACDTLQYLKIHHPDLVIMDIDLPDLDGFSLVEKIRSDVDEWLPIIFHSSRRDEDSIKRAYAAGADEYVVKIKNPGEILGRISDFSGIIDTLKNHRRWPVPPQIKSIDNPANNHK